MAGSDRITLNFGANTREVEQGTDRIADSLTDTERKLEDVGRAGEDAGDAAAGGLADVGTSAGDVGTQLGDLGNIATDVLEGDVAGGARSAVGAISGLAALIPGVGAAIGSGLALAANAFIGAWEQAAKTNEDRIKSMYEDMIASGRDFASTEFVNSEIDKIVEDDARLAQVKADAAEAGVKLSIALRAEAGDQVALSTVLQAVRDRRDELNRQQQDYIEKNNDVNAALDEQIGGLDLLEIAYGSVADRTDTASEKANIYRDATEGAYTATGTLHDALENLPKSVYSSIEVKVPSGASIVKSMQRAIDRQPHLVVSAEVKTFGRVNP